MSDVAFEASVEVTPQPEFSSSVDVNVKALSSIALARIVEEVRHDESLVTNAYDRTHNRHNR